MDHFFAVLGRYSDLPGGKKTAMELDRIAREVGGPGCGYSYWVDEQGAHGFGYCPNRGNPFNEWTAKSIMDAWKEAGVWAPATGGKGKYVLNSAVITAPGDYRYRLVSQEEARKWAEGGFISTVGYEQTAEALELVLGRPVPVDRRTIVMQPGDEALVFRLAFPPGTPRVAPGDKGKIEGAILAGHFELGLLSRLS